MCTCEEGWPSLWPSGSPYLWRSEFTLTNQLLDLVLLQPSCLWAISRSTLSPLAKVPNRMNRLLSWMPWAGICPASKYTASSAVRSGKCWISFSIYVCGIWQVWKNQPVWELLRQDHGTTKIVKSLAERSGLTPLLPCSPNTHKGVGSPSCQLDTLVDKFGLIFFCRPQDPKMSATWWEFQGFVT